jgi:hypothetical protein
MKHGSLTWNTDSSLLWGLSTSAGSLLWDKGTQTDVVAAPERRWSDSARDDADTTDETSSDAPLSRAQIVTRILSFNASATLDYLAQFDDAALRNYLDHLETAQKPRGPRSRWVRRGDSRAIVGREAEY